MKRTLLLSVVCLAACDLPPPPDNTPEATFPVGAPGVANAGGHLSTGKWADHTTCSAGGVLTGSFNTDYGLDPPAKMGTVPVACRPVATKLYYADCNSTGVKPSACAVRVWPDGTIELTTTPFYDFWVTPDWTKPL